jgi:DNA gyrase/topoisomerase IV subunit B
MEIDSQYDESEIVVLDAIDAIRCHTNLYLGQLERDDLFDDLIFESLCHAIDEKLLGKHKIHLDRLQIKAEELMHDFKIRIEIANV